MKYIWKNIKTFCQSETGFFILGILCIFLSLQMMLTAYGLFGIYTIKKTAEEQNLSSLQFTFSDAVTKQEFAEAIKKVPQELNDKILQYYITVELPQQNRSSSWKDLDFHITVRNGKITISSQFAENTKDSGTIPEFFTEEQESNGELVALTSDFDLESLEKFQSDGETIEVFGQTYQIIGKQRWSLIMIPFSSLPDDTILSGESVSMYEPITKQDYDQLRTVLTRELDNRISFPDLNIPDLNELYRYNTVLWVNLFIICASALNFALLYRYLMMKRRGELAVFRLCGLRKGKAALLYLGECIGLILPGTAVAFGCFHWLILPILAKVHGDIVTLYSPVIYGKLIAGYLAVTFVILAVVIGMELRSSSLTLWLRGKRYE